MTSRIQLRLIMNDDNCYEAVWHKALTLLGRREYSAYELHARLMRHHFDDDIVSDVIAALQDKGWQSDERFTEMLVRTRYQQGKGPNRIRYELGQKGIDEALIEGYVDNHDQAWFEAAVYALDKKRRGHSLDDKHFKMKCMRYLYQQGFTRDHSDYAFNCLQSDD